MYFRDLIGHQEQIETFGRIYRTGRLPHGLLLCGPAGIGKRLFADSLVAARFCREREAEACGRCPSCKSFAHGNHADLERIQRIPGKRDIGIGQIRELLETLHRKSESDRGRAAIIEDAERLTVEAQNAFLKSLEEPPPDTLLILITSSLQRLLPTVRSRCSIWRFGPLLERELAEFVRRREEPLGQLPLTLARGSPGWLCRMADERLVEGRNALLGFISGERAASVFDLAAELQACASIPAAAEEDAADDGREQSRDRLLLLMQMLSLALRDLAALSGGAGDVLLFNSDRRESLSKRADSLSPEAVLDALERIERTCLHLRRNMDAGLALEVGLQGVAEALARR
jgi:DNA polymerase-3 subunit delta'